MSIRGMSFVRWLAVMVAGVAFVVLQLPVRAAQNAVVTCIADTGLIEQNTNYNLGGMAFLPVGKAGAGTRGRGLYKFNVGASIPAGAVVRGATLELEVVNNELDTDRSFSVHRLLVDWGEGDKTGSAGAPATSGEATWYARFHPNVTWAQLGGADGVDYSSIPSASEQLSGAGRYFFSSETLARDVQAWLDNPNSNFGWLAKIDSELATDTTLMFASREDTEGAAPVLRVEYDPPGLTRPILTNSRRNGSNFQFDFNADANRTYFAEYSTNLRVWNFLDLVAPGPARTVTITDTMATEPRFYRVTGL